MKEYKVMSPRKSLSSMDNPLKYCERVFLGDCVKFCIDGLPLKSTLLFFNRTTKGMKNRLRYLSQFKPYFCGDKPLNLNL